MSFNGNKFIFWKEGSQGSTKSFDLIDESEEGSPENLHITLIQVISEMLDLNQSEIKVLKEKYLPAYESDPQNDIHHNPKSIIKTISIEEKNIKIRYSSGESSTITKEDLGEKKIIPQISIFILSTEFGILKWKKKNFICTYDDSDTKYFEKIPRKQKFFGRKSFS